jgi:hypothetical protein
MASNRVLFCEYHLETTKVESDFETAAQRIVKIHNGDLVVTLQKTIYIKGSHVKQKSLHSPRGI